MKPQTREALKKLKKRLIDDTQGTPLEEESRALYEEIERQLESAERTQSQTIEERIARARDLAMFHGREAQREPLE